MSGDPVAPLVIPDDNRPRPLDVPPIFLLGDTLCQMSFGERAALEGILSELKPRLAVEVGTYVGGSLGFLAPHSGHVHALDMYDLVDDRTAFPNVTFHIGDSKTVLPELLRKLEAEREQIDFALVDGDHSSTGVRQDLASLLNSAATRSTIILLHDTISEETRSGIESVDLSAHPKVVYYELDFIPGYEFVGGHFDGQAWGGLGLIVTGDRGSEGYGTSPRQSLYREAFELRSHATAVRTEIRGLENELTARRREVEHGRRYVSAMESSISWRVTAPLRWLKRRVIGPRHS